MSAPPMLSQCTAAMDGKWEGWCWYPDQPLERAVVEVIVGSRSVRAVRAARLRTDIRDLGMGDGYCGFQLPFPSKEHQSGHAFVEVKERRFGRVLGRIVVAEDARLQAKDLRLRSAAEALRVADDDLTRLSARLRRRAEPLEELGAILSHLSEHRARPSMDSSQMGAWAVARARMTAVPPSDLGFYRQPRVTLVLCASHGGIARDVVALSAELRAAALTLRQVGAEFMLVDEGVAPLASLLPGRLRHLRVVRSMPGAALGAALNSAALAARGTWLAFARPTAIGIAQLLDVVRDAVAGTFHIEDASTHPQPVSHHHRLKALVTRDAFHETGGFDPQLDEPALWADLLERATLVGHRVVKWHSPRDSKCDGGLRREPPHGWG